MLQIDSSVPVLFRCWTRQQSRQGQALLARDDSRQNLNQEEHVTFLPSYHWEVFKGFKSCFKKFKFFMNIAIFYGSIHRTTLSVEEMIQCISFETNILLKISLFAFHVLYFSPVLLTQLTVVAKLGVQSLILLRCA